MHSYAPQLAALLKYQEHVKLGGNHQYRVDGVHKPGVTTIIKIMDAPKLDDWKVRVQVEGTARAAYTNPPLPNEPMDGYVARLKVLGEKEKEHERLSDEAARIGTDVHALIEHAIKGMLGQPIPKPEVCEEALFRFAGWRAWAQDVGMKPLAAEARMYNSEHDYCGTLDSLVTVRAKGRDALAVLDWKPTPVLYDERQLQSAAYRKSLKSMGWPDMEGAIVCIPRDGGDISMIYADEPGPELDKTFNAFLSLLNVYRWQAEKRRAGKKKAA